MKNVRALAWMMGLGLAGCAGTPTAPPPELLFFVGSECPVSNFYAPEIQRLGEAWQARGGRVRLVYPEPGLRLEDARAHARRFALKLPVAVDPERSLAAAHGVERVPTAVLAGAYRGRIDDRFSPEGKRRDVPRSRDLEEALNALAEGRAPAVRETPVFGCPLP
jgi:hypothetical protein